MMKRISLTMLMAMAVELTALVSVARADDRGQISVIEENDSIFYPSDKHYTQGIRFSYLTSPLTADESLNAPFDWFGDLPFAPSGTKTRFADYGFGQSIFTPTAIHQRVPDPHDRPYAGWLYGDLALIQDTDHERLDDLELQLGIVGPNALGRQVQNDWHIDVLGVRPALGWAHQLSNEPGMVASYNRKLRFLAETDGHFGVDFIPEAGASVGNIFTYAAVGAMARIGLNLANDYGPPRILPGQSGSDYYDPSAGGPIAAYLFVGTEGRLVGRNIFLDGNTYQSSASVDKRIGVYDATFGGAVRVGPNFRVTYAFVERSEEFFGQQGPDRFSSISLSYHLIW
jgi:lipid A 3-O-deacylase